MISETRYVPLNLNKVYDDFKSGTFDPYGHDYGELSDNDLYILRQAIKNGRDHIIGDFQKRAIDTIAEVGIGGALAVTVP